MEQTTNKGTGAGGSNTNKNGLRYEELTYLDDRITILEKGKFSNTIKFDNNERRLTKTKQSKMFKCMKDNITPLNILNADLIQIFKGVIKYFIKCSFLIKYLKVVNEPIF